MFSAFANAWLDRVPMIATSGRTERKREQPFAHHVLGHNRLLLPVSQF
jgi:acetolactate synthase-1/2/3 large subunit